MQLVLNSLHLTNLSSLSNVSYLHCLYTWDAYTSGPRNSDQGCMAQSFIRGEYFARKLVCVYFKMFSFFCSKLPLFPHIFIVKYSPLVLIITGGPGGQLRWGETEPRWVPVPDSLDIGNFIFFWNHQKFIEKCSLLTQGFEVSMVILTSPSIHGSHRII